jgi:hypothetical protein
MERKDLFTLIKNGLAPQVSTEFTSEDANSAAINAIREYFGLTMESSIREIRACEQAAFALVEEAVDEILPKRLENVMGKFADVRTFARDEEVVFTIGKIGKNRAKLSIVKGARGGIYRAARLDSVNFQLPTEVYTVAIYVTLEDLILGTYTLAELYNNILEGFEEIIYAETIKALTDANAVASGSYDNHVTTTSATIESALDECIYRIKQFGNPIVMGFYNQLAKIQNYFINETTYPSIPQQDLDDLRRIGHISLYKGTTIVELPNYLKDEFAQGADGWLLDDSYIYVIPSDAKPVKVAFKGEMTIVPNRQATGSEKWEAHKLMGVGVAMNHNYAVIEVTD